MRTKEQRINELERRVAYLEAELRKIQEGVGANAVMPSEEVSEPLDTRSLTERERESVRSGEQAAGFSPFPPQASVQSPEIAAQRPDILPELPHSAAAAAEPSASGANATVHSQKRSFSDLLKHRESLIGKYLVGALASLLVLIGAISFIAIIWSRITPQLRVTIIGLSGLTIAAAGLKMTLKKRNPIASILLGTGSGLVYIAILSANLIFHLITLELSVCLCGIWTILLILSYRYTQLLFTVLLAYLGSWTTLLFELKHISSESGSVLLFIYVCAISATIIRTLHESKSAHRLLSLALSAISYLTLVLFCQTVMPVVFFKMEIGAVIALLVLKNMAYRLADDHFENKPLVLSSLGFSLASTLSLIALLSNTMKYAFDLSSLTALALFFAIQLLQFLANFKYFNKHLEDYQCIYYMLWLYLFALLICGELLYFQLGATAIALLLLLRKYLIKKQVPLAPFFGMCFFDLFMSLRTSDPLILVFLSLNLILAFYIARDSYKTKHELRTKNTMLSLLMFSCFPIGRELGNNLLESIFNPSFDLELISIMFLLSLSLLALYHIRYFDTDAESGRQRPLRRYIGWIIAAVLTYLIGIPVYYFTGGDIPRQITLLLMLLISLHQTRLMLHSPDSSGIVGETIWLVVRYGMLPWYGLWGLFFGLSHFVLIYAHTRTLRKGFYIFLLKNISFVVLIASCLSSGHTIAEWTRMSELSPDASLIIRHALGLVALLIVYRTDFLSGEIEPTKPKYERLVLFMRRYTAIYPCAMLLYFVGLDSLVEADTMAIKFLLTLTTFLVAGFQTYFIFSEKIRISYPLGIWTVLKYLIFTWTVMRAFLELPIESVLYSVSGLILAVLAIYLGFKRSVPVIRQFGLGITILMVAKFILVDLNGENSITRVVAFVAGGILCFIVSVIYNRLSKSDSEQAP